jgi:hypothetical protein
MGDNKLVAIDLVSATYRSAALAPAPYHLTTVRGNNKIYVSSSESPKMWVLDAVDLEIVETSPSCLSMVGFLLECLLLPT